MASSTELVHDSTSYVFQTLAEFLKKGTLKPSEWAERYRVLKNTGPWRWRGYEYLRQIHDDEHPHLIMPKGAQLGLTETLLNLAIYFLDVRKMDVLYTFPTEDDANDFSAARFDVALDYSPYLASLFTDVKNKGHKRAGSVNFYCRTSGSRSKMKSIPVAVLFLDEVDEMDQESISLAEERTSGHIERYQRDASTPTIPDFGIWKRWQKAEQWEYFLPCPYCGKKAVLRWEDSIEWKGNDARTARFKCAVCGRPWTEYNRIEARANGKWQKVQDGVDDLRGYHVSQLYSPAQTARSLVAKFLEVEDDEIRKQEFFNSKLGLPYLMEGARLAGYLIDACKDSSLLRKDSSTDTVIGIDVAGANKPNWVEVSEWREGVKTVIHAGRAAWDKLDDMMIDYHARLAVIDALPETTKAREFIERWPGRAYMAYYVEGLKVPYRIKEEDQILDINRTEALDKALQRFRGNRVRLARNIPLYETYKTHLCSPAKIYKEDKRGIPIPRYVNNGADHFAHAAAYAEIAGIVSPAGVAYVDTWTPPGPEGDFML